MSIASPKSSRSSKFGKFINFSEEVGKILKEFKVSHWSAIFGMAVLCFSVGWKASQLYYGEKTVSIDMIEKDYVPVKTVQDNYIKAELVRREYVPRSQYLELLNSEKKAGRDLASLKKELEAARNETEAGKDIEKALRNNPSKREIEIEELKRKLRDAQKSLEGRKKTEILAAQIDYIRYEIRDVENEIDNIEHKIESLRADAAFFKKDYEINGKKLLPKSQEIVITEQFLQDLQNDRVIFVDIDWLEIIKERKLEIGDKIEIELPGPQEYNITAAARYEAEATASEDKKQRLLEKLKSLRAQLNGLIAAARDG